ncbi:hypothetical protein TBK1r_50670 [Stieleria magnilauensis]|uniref:Uncharacterized protein n=1 Tax=Stieleria magnilauensis TaxID=2527963 RepID=A0ABX5XYP0_9BACT|nr:hypothetical protein TBK1r_50670 [Planctomycetes bacterium TBK1r]
MCQNFVSLHVGLFWDSIRTDPGRACQRFRSRRTRIGLRYQPGHASLLVRRASVHDGLPISSIGVSESLPQCSQNRPSTISQLPDLPTSHAHPSHGSGNKRIGLVSPRDAKAQRADRVLAVIAATFSPSSASRISWPQFISVVLVTASRSHGCTSKIQSRSTPEEPRVVCSVGFFFQ